MKFKDWNKRIENLKKITDIQGSNGNWNHSPYMHGLYNGMELGLATVQGREPKYKDAPKEWLEKRKLKKKPTVAS